MDIKLPSVQNPELSKFLSVQPVLGQNIDLNAPPAARKSLLLIFTFPFPSASSFFFFF